MQSLEIALTRDSFVIAERHDCRLCLGDNAPKIYMTCSRTLLKNVLMKRYLIIAVIFLLSAAGIANAQRVAVKTNALYWATATPNLGFEISLADRWTLEMAGGYNPWTFDAEENLKMKHFLVTPEVRYWFCESFNGHFIGINGNYTQFNASGSLLPVEKLENSRLEGWAAGAGLTYGYAWPISRRWNMEFTLGLGYWHSEYDRYESRKCGMFIDHNVINTLGLTDFGISFIYLIK